METCHLGEVMLGAGVGVGIGEVKGGKRVVTPCQLPAFARTGPTPEDLGPSQYMKRLIQALILRTHAHIHPLAMATPNGEGPREALVPLNLQGKGQ